MNIVVTGATGFIGKHLVKRLQQEHQVYVLARPSSNVSQFEAKQVLIFDGNVDALTQSFQEKKIEGIIHLASLYLAQHKSNQIEDLVLSNIYFGTALLEASKAANVKWFLNTGTIWQNYESPDFADVYNPVNLYAATKQAFITMSKYYTETSDLRFSTLKLCDTFGPNDTRRKIFNLFAQIAESGETLDMSAGEQYLDIVHVDKVVDGFLALMNLLSDPNRKYREEYVVTSGKQIRLKDLAKQYEQEHHVTLNINWGGRPYREREVMRPYVGNPI